MNTLLNTPLFFFSVNFTSTKTCLSLQCSHEDTRFIPQECSTNLEKICKNWSKFAFFKSLISFCIAYNIINDKSKISGTQLNDLNDHFQRHYYINAFLGKPDNGYASNWSSSMEECKNSHPPHYLLGNIRLNDSRFVCHSLNYQVEVVWVGVARQFYTSIDKGIYELYSL